MTRKTENNKKKDGNDAEFSYAMWMNYTKAERRDNIPCKS